MWPQGSRFGTESASSWTTPSAGACISSLQMMHMLSTASSSATAFGSKSNDRIARRD